MGLSKREKQVMDELLTAVPSVVAIRVGISTHNIDVIKSNVRRKEAATKKFLNQLKKYNRILHPPRKYKGL
ncbi:hypothetical protein ES703_117106 [subsurface metagenome]